MQTSSNPENLSPLQLIIRFTAVALATLAGFYLNYLESISL